MSAKCQFNNSNIIEMKALQVDTLWKILTNKFVKFQLLVWWSKLIQNAPFEIKISGGIRQFSNT